jgi:hypothetical protein
MPSHFTGIWERKTNGPGLYRVRLKYIIRSGEGEKDVRESALPMFGHKKEETKKDRGSYENPAGIVRDAAISKRTEGASQVILCH